MQLQSLLIVVFMVISVNIRNSNLSFKFISIGDFSNSNGLEEFTLGLDGIMGISQNTNPNTNFPDQTAIFIKIFIFWFGDIFSE